VDDVADAATDVTDKILIERVDAILHQRVKRKRKLDAHKLVRVLVVEDNQADAELLFDFLEGSESVEFDHDLVGDIEHACVALRERHYDCVVLDLALPDAKGLEGLIALQERKEDVPIVVLTGFVGTYGKEAIRRGAQDYLNKGSITASLLERAVCYAIERHQHQAQLVMANVELQRFAGAVAHDLTTPLTAIAGFAQTLEQLVPSLDDDARRCVERIVDNVDRATNMIRDLLAHGVAVAAGDNKDAVDLLEPGDDLGQVPSG
jgi:DNA-binding response OmpR family regulator